MCVQLFVVSCKLESFNEVSGSWVRVMSEKLSVEVKAFKVNLEAKLAAGLSDLKFFAREVSDATFDSFVEQVNAVDRKVAAGEFDELDWKRGESILRSC